MKKLITTIIFAFLLGFFVSAQSDTTLVKGNVTMDTESYVNKKGETKTTYYCLLNGSYFVSDKTSWRRYNAYKRFGVVPQFVLISNKKTKAQKIIVL